MTPGQKVRSTGDGQMGEIVEMEGGGLGVRIDRPQETRIVPFHPSKWALHAKVTLGPQQVARICYEADRALRMAKGEYAVKDWLSTTEQARIAFAKLGPDKDEDRIRLFAAINEALAGA